MRTARAGRMIKTAAFVAVVGLFGAGSVGTASALTVTRGSTPAQMVTAPALTVALPDPDRLRSALLKADELGPAFVQKPTAGPSLSPPENKKKGTRFEGCRPLARLLNADNSGRSDHPQAAATFASRDGATSVSEALTAEPPAALHADYAKAKHALESCDSISLVSAGSRIKFALRPIHFGGPGSSAVRMDASYQGVLVNGYIAIEQLGKSVALTYTFFQVGGGSSQLASFFYQRAADKARTTLDL